MLFLVLHLSLLLPLSLLAVCFHTSLCPLHTHTDPHTARLTISSMLLLLSVVLSLPIRLHSPYFSFSLHITLTLSPLLPLLSLSLSGHVAAAPAEIIGAKAWVCYLHRNSMTPQAASGEGHRDHLSQNFNENFCWDRDFIPCAPSPTHIVSFHSFTNTHSSPVPSIPSWCSLLFSSLSVAAQCDLKLDDTSVLRSCEPLAHQNHWRFVKRCMRYGELEMSL